MCQRFSVPVCLLLSLTGVLWGCASSQPSSEEVATQASAIGTWKYQVQGIAPLDEGLFYISMQDGRLRALVRDQQRGRLHARANVRASRLELTIDQLRISGWIENGQFSGFLRSQEWTVTRSYQQPQSRSMQQSASISAERIRSVRAVNEVGALDCRSLLREVNGCP